MKLNKFLALLLCMTLCIVPLPFSIHAHSDAEIIPLSDYIEYVDCPRCGSSNYFETSISGIYYVPVGTASVCYRQYCETVNLRCQDCGKTGTESHVLLGTFPHSNLNYTTKEINGELITAYFCLTCDYYHY